MTNGSSKTNIGSPMNLNPELDSRENG